MSDRNALREQQRANTRKLLDTFGIATDNVMVDIVDADLQESEGRLVIRTEYHFAFDDMTEEQVSKVREVFGVQVVPIWKFSS